MQPFFCRVPLPRQTFDSLTRQKFALTSTKQTHQRIHGLADKERPVSIDGDLGQNVVDGRYLVIPGLAPCWLLWVLRRQRALPEAAG
jgi:hypothetical protein